jgi:DNA-binding NarL/FixJ family response regulator
VRVLLADDHAIVRDGLHAILTTRPGIEVVGFATNGREAVALVRTLQPAVVVMDVIMQELNGIEATRKIVAEWPNVRVIGLSMHSDRAYVAAMLKAGACAYLPKDSSSAEFLQAFDAVSNGHRYVSPAIIGAVVDALKIGERGQSHQLTSREREVLQLVAEGCTSKEIALRMNITPTTAESYRRLIMSKLDLHSIAGLTKFAIRAGLTTLEK